MLEVKGLSATYGKHRALDGASLQVAPGEVLSDPEVIRAYLGDDDA